MLIKHRMSIVGDISALGVNTGLISIHIRMIITINTCEFKTQVKINIE